MSVFRMVPYEDTSLVINLGWIYELCAEANNAVALGNLADAIHKYKQALDGPWHRHLNPNKSMPTEEFARRLADPDNAPVIVALTSTLYRDAIQKLYQSDRQGALQTLT